MQRFEIQELSNWGTKYRLRFRFRSFPLVLLYGIASLLLAITIVGVVFWVPLWAHYLVNNIEIEEMTASPEIKQG